MGKFEDNGGYYIDGVPYMDCKITGEPVKNVSTDAKSVIGDIRDYSKMKKTIQKSSPDFLIHMAAQPLVRFSYDHPNEIENK